MEAGMLCSVLVKSKLEWLLVMEVHLQRGISTCFAMYLRASFACKQTFRYI